MKEINLSDQSKRRQNALLGKLRLVGDSAAKEKEAAQTVARKLSQIMDNNFILLRYVELEGPNVPIPLILVGPTGIWVLYPSPEKGVYRVLEESWEALNERTKKYQPVQPNLLHRTRLMSQAVATFMRNQGIDSGEVGAVLIMTDPGAHVDAVRPAARIVQIDALDRFVANLLQTRVSLSKEKIQQIVDALVGDKIQIEAPRETIDAFTLREEAAPRRAASPGLLERIDPSFVNRVPFTTRQWAVLGVLMVALAVLLVVAIVVLLVIF